MLEILGVQFDVDVTDVDFAGNFEESNKAVVDGLDKIDKSQSIREVLGAQCELVFAFFDSVLGEGTSGKLFKGKRSMRDCLTAYDAIITYFNNEAGKISDIALGMQKKYTPNRATRRTQK